MFLKKDKLYTINDVLNKPMIELYGDEWEQFQQIKEDLEKSQNTYRILK